MGHTVSVGQFEGPLGLLLELIERNKLEVSDISVGHITAEYLAKVQALPDSSIEEMSEFLQLGARLLYIKSLALLPRADSEEQARELEQLNLELAEYRRFQAGARLLAQRLDQRTWERPAAVKLAVHELPLPRLELDQLAAAFAAALKKAPAAPPTATLKPHLSLETVTKKLRVRLDQGFMLHTIIESCRDRAEIVVTFLAVLELVRDGAARVTQAGQFDPIKVEAARA